MQKHRYKLFLILIVIAMIGGCGEMPISPGYSLRPGSGKGLFVISTTMHRSADLIYGSINNIAYLIDLDDGVSPGGSRKSFAKIQAACGRGYDWYDYALTPGTEYGCVAAFELPPGKYALTYIYALGGGGTSGNKVPYHFKFTVKDGMVSYFGNLAVDIPDLSNGHRRGNAVTFVVRRTDRRERDIPLFLKKYHEFQATDIFYGD